MNSSSVKITFGAAIGISIVIVGWYFYKLCSAGFLNPNGSLSPDISAYVGGFIGGTIGLIISITTLIILYQTYFSQNRQHTDLQLTSSIELLMKMHESIVIDIQNLEFVGHKGEISILYFNAPKIPNIFLDKLNFIINSYSLLISRCKNIIKQHKDSKMIEVANDLLARFYLSFYTKIIWVIIADDKNDSSKPQPFDIYIFLVKNGHDDAKYFLKTFGLLAKETLEYLNEKRLITIDSDWKRKSLDKIKKFVDATE